MFDLPHCDGGECAYGDVLQVMLNMSSFTLVHLSQLLTLQLYFVTHFYYFWSRLKSTGVKLYSNLTNLIKVE